MGSSPTSSDPPLHGGSVSHAARTPIIESLSARFRGPLRRFFLKRRIPRDDVDDLVQEVFVRMASRPGVESMERLEAYIFTIASNLLRDRYRRMTSRGADAHEPYDEAVHGGEQETHGPDRALLATQIVVQLIEALYELPERTRTVFTLYHIEGLSHREISLRLGMPISTLEKHMGRAMAHLIKRTEKL